MAGLQPHDYVSMLSIAGVIFVGGIAASMMASPGKPRHAQTSDPARFIGALAILAAVSLLSGLVVWATLNTWVLSGSPPFGH